MKKFLLMLVLGASFACASLSAGAQSIFNCSSGFSASGSCGVAINFPLNETFYIVGAFSGFPVNLQGNSVMLAATTAGHAAITMNYSPAQVNDQYFQTHITYNPNGWNLAFVLQNNTNTQGGSYGFGNQFSSGAGCEGSIYQAFPNGTIVPDYNTPNNIFAIMEDQRSPLTDGNGTGQGGGSYPGTFTYSNVQLYGEGADPCNPRDGTEPYFYFTQKISTSPVPLNYPAASLNTAAGGSVCTAYSESAGTTTMTCSVPSGASAFTAGQSLMISATSTDALSAYNGQTVTVLASPAPTTTSWAFTGSTVTGSGSTAATTGDNISETITYQGTNVTAQIYDITAGGSCPGSSCFTHTWTNISVPSMTQGTTAWAGLSESTNAATGYPLLINTWSYTQLSAAAAPSISPAAGTYGSTQSVTITDSSTGSIICYNTTGNPSTNGVGGCTVGTLYSGAISVPKGQTIYAVAGSGTSNLYGDSAVTSAAYNITGSASQPTFSAGTGTYYGNQSVILTAANGGVICYNTTGSPATNGSTGCATGTLYSVPVVVSANETLYAVAGGTGFTDSAVNSAAYIISPYWGTYADSPVPAATPTFSPLPGSYSGTQSVSLSTTTPGAYICYLLSATPLTIGPYPDSQGGCAAASFTGSISGTTLTVSAMNYGTIQNGQTVSGAGVTAGTTISSGCSGSSCQAGSYVVNHSQTVGSETMYLNANSNFYTGPISVSSTQYLYAASGTPLTYLNYCGSGGTTCTGSSTPSTATRGLFTITGGSATAPSCTPTSGSSNSPITVTCTNSNTGTTVMCQTEDGSTPTTNGAGTTCTHGTLVTSTISISSTVTTLKVVAGTSTLSDSTVSTYGAYTIEATATAPSCTPTSGSSASPITVTCTNSNSGTTIMCYTENGSAPATNGTGNGCATGTSLTGSSNTVSISSTVTTLKVIAGTSADFDSTVSSYGAYTISSGTTSQGSGVSARGVTFN